MDNSTQATKGPEKLKAEGWERQEPGWWTHPQHGGVCRERVGWCAYPREGLKLGPFPTLTDAAKIASEYSHA